MVSSRVAARAVCAAVGFLLLAGSARAQFSECPLPSDVPDVVLGSITETADLAFGDLSQATCDSIVKKGVALCKAQVKAAAKCGLKSTAAVYAMILKQCAEAPAEERAACKEGAKTFRGFYVTGYQESAEEGVADCESDVFAMLLNAACMDLVIKVGGP